MTGIRADSRNVRPSQVFEPDGDDVDALRIRRELAGGIEQCLRDLVIGSESYFDIQVQATSPEIDDEFYGLGGEGRADRETKARAQI